MGHVRCTNAIDDSSTTISAVISLGNQPGASAFTRTPLRAHCAASSRVRLTTAPFDAQYDACFTGVEATSPSIDATLTIDPEPCSIIVRPTDCDSTNNPLRFTSITSRNWSGVSTSAGRVYALPALLTRTSTRPNRPAAADVRRSQSASLVTSHGITANRVSSPT